VLPRWREMADDRAALQVDGNGDLVPDLHAGVLSMRPGHQRKFCGGKLARGAID
jgi:hypothetical protein